MPVYVGDLLTASAATTTGKPTPTRTWQWLRGSTAISGATSSTYTVAEADLGANLSVKQIETNIAGTAEATSNAVGPVELFTPLSLFASGEEGAWYEPSTTTAFLSTTDLTPCTYGNACGLLLDKSQGAGYADGSFTGLGTELVTNGDFSTSDLTGWVNAGFTSATVVSGQLELVHTGTSVSEYRFDVSVVAGKSYAFGGSVGSDASSSASSLSLKRGTSTVATIFATSADGSAASGQIVYTATATETISVALRAGLQNTTRLWDNVSVRELPGNHATQTTLASRPILARVPETGRRNLLERTEEFSNSDSWVPFRSSEEDNTLDVTDPLGGNTASKITVTNAGGSLNQAQAVTAGVEYTLSLYVLRGTATDLKYALYDSTNAVWIGPGGSGGASYYSQTNDSTWSRVQFSITAPAGCTEILFYPLKSQPTGSVYLWGAQLETGSTATDYQKVVTSYDITEAGVTSLEYLSFDGVDDGMVTPTITPGIDKAQVFAGYRSLNTVSGVIAELSTNSFISTGGLLIAQGCVTGQRGVGALMTTIGAESAAQTIPYTGVTTTAFDKALVGVANEIAIRLNGAPLALPNTTGTDSGTGNFLAYPLYIGRRAGTAAPFLGNIYSLIVRFGTNLDTLVIQNTEAYLATRSGVTLP
jgi:hypothetical protein